QPFRKFHACASLEIVARSTLKLLAMALWLSPSANRSKASCRWLRAVVAMLHISRPTLLALLARSIAAQSVDCRGHPCLAGGRSGDDGCMMQRVVLHDAGVVAAKPSFLWSWACSRTINVDTSMTWLSIIRRRQRIDSTRSRLRVAVAGTGLK